MGTDGFLASVPDFRITNNQQPLLSSHIGSRSEEPSSVHRPRAWTRPSKGREEERKRESERKERAKMGTDGFLASVPDFRSSASRDLALTNDFRTVALYHSLLTTHHSQPLLSSHYGSRSTNHTAVALGKSAVSIPLWFSLNKPRASRASITSTPRFHPTMVLAQRAFICWERTAVTSRFHPTMVLAQPYMFVAARRRRTQFPSHYGSRSTSEWKRMKSCAR
jgi:hypothetical protein